MKFEDLKKFLIKISASVFFVGYLPLAPGTFGSIVGAGLFYLLQGHGWFVYFLGVFLVAILGMFVSGRMEKLLNRKDPSCVVIDEVMGMLVALSFVPADLKVVILGFLIFRIMDTFKPYPAGRLQNRSGSFGVMVDDLIAGIYTNIVLQIILRLAVFKAV